mmetsp:Transcript_68704/g.147178  ORF Transcript_68704/g.147178 Transcript_68704/m.147178 type:complete len:277 (-) Transcript_68704:106-936(-)
MLRVLHQELPDSESIELAVFVVVGLHHLEELYYLLKVHGEEGVLQNLEDRDRDPKYHRKALAHDGVPDDQDHREREAIDEERQEPLVEVHGGLHVFLDEVIPQLRHGLLHEAVTDAQVAAQQRKPLFVEPCEPELGMVHEAHEHGEALLLAPRNEEQEAGDEVHALAIAQLGVIARVGIEHPEQALLLRCIEGPQLGECPADVYLDQRGPLILSGAQAVVIMRQLVLLEPHCCLPDLPTEARRDAAPHTPVEPVRMAAHVLRYPCLDHLGPLGKLA